MDVQQLTVTVYAETNNLTGLISIPKDSRLLDLLNDGLSTGYQKGNAFIELDGVTVFGTSGPRERFTNLYMAKSIIHMVETPNSNSARGIGAKVGSKDYPFRQKSPVRVRLQIPNYALIGNMHCASGEIVLDVLNAVSMFLPLTDVKLNAEGTSHWQPAAFLAVNRKEIFSVQLQEAT